MRYLYQKVFVMNSPLLCTEITTKGIRSSGPGGQHVNKVASKVELSFDILNSNGLSESEKDLLTKRLQSRLTKQQILILQCDESRSQHRNKDLVVKRFLTLLKNTLHVSKPRKSTKPSKASIQKRLQKKKIHALKKANRRRPESD